MKLFFSFLFITCSLFVVAQTPVKLRKYNNGSEFIDVSLPNLLAIINMNPGEFEQLMKNYNYSFFKTDYFLWQGGGVDAAEYLILKKIGFAGFTWTESSNMIFALKDQLTKYYVGERSGITKYKILYDKTKYEASLKNYESGGGYIILEKLKK